MGSVDEVRTLELRLLDPAVRGRPEAVEALLHPDFTEFGASGWAWDRAAIVAALRGDPGGPIDVRDLTVRELAAGVALVTYRVTGRGASLRASVWVDDGDGWRMRFHQGTPAAG